MRLSETSKVIYVFKPGDHAAGVTGESINCEGCSHISYILECATFTDNAGNGAALTVKSGATDATQTTAETFYYRIASAAQAATDADIYGAETAATTYELLKATVENKCLIIEVDVASLTAGQPYLTLALSNESTAANCSCVAILQGLRYASENPPTAIG